MTYYLLDHPPRSPQYRTPRREALSGVVVLHTAEGGLWTPAGNVARFIANRPDPGSYHTIIDPRSTVELIPDTAEAFHVAADGHNRHTYGLAFSTSAHLWSLSTDDDLALRRAGQRIATFALAWAGGDTVKARTVARIINRQQALDRQPGITLHGVLQPSDRSDAWLNSPHRHELERRLIRYTTDHLTGDDTMTPAQEAKLDALADEVAALRATLHPSEKLRQQIDRIEKTSASAATTAGKILELLLAAKLGGIRVSVVAIKKHLGLPTGPGD